MLRLTLLVFWVSSMFTWLHVHRGVWIVSRIRMCLSCTPCACDSQHDFVWTETPLPVQADALTVLSH